MKPTLSIALILLLACPAGCVSKSTLLTETDRRQSCEAQLQENGDELQECRNRFQNLLGEKARLLEINENLLEDNTGLLSERNELSGTLDEARLSLDRSRDEISRLTGTYDDLISNLESEIEHGQVEITQLRGRLTVRLTDKVLFDIGRADLNEKGEDVLRKVGKTLALVENKVIMVEGHTDDQPILGAHLKNRYPTNWELSTARASTVVRFLQESAGIDPTNLVAAGCSEYRPVASNEFVEGRRMNRRIEIKLIPPD